MDNNINALIRKYRKYRRISLQELSNLTGIHRLTLNKFELNQLDITLSKFIKIINVLEIDEQELLINLLQDKI